MCVSSIERIRWRRVACGACITTAVAITGVLMVGAERAHAVLVCIPNTTICFDFQPLEPIKCTLPQEPLPPDPELCLNISSQGGNVAGGGDADAQGGDGGDAVSTVVQEGNGNATVDVAGGAGQAQGGDTTGTAGSAAGGDGGDGEASGGDATAVNLNLSAGSTGPAVEVIEQGGNVAAGGDADAQGGGGGDAVSTVVQEGNGNATVDVAGGAGQAQGGDTTGTAGSAAGGDGGDGEASGGDATAVNLSLPAGTTTPVAQDGEADVG